MGPTSSREDQFEEPIGDDEGLQINPRPNASPHVVSLASSRPRSTSIVRSHSRSSV